MNELKDFFKSWPWRFMAIFIIANVSGGISEYFDLPWAKDAFFIFLPAYFICYLIYYRRKKEKDE